MTNVEVLTRKIAGNASCGHRVEKDEKYLKVYRIGDTFSGAVPSSTKCEKCGLKYMTNTIKQAIKDIVALATKKGVSLK